MRFVETERIETVGAQTLTIKSRKMSGGNHLRLFGVFAKRRLASLIVTALIIACLIAVLGVCQLFTNFDGDAELSNLVAENNDDFVIFQKGYEARDIYNTLKSDEVIRATDKDVQSFYENGYSGNVYGLYNISLLYQFNWTLQNFLLNPKSIYNNFYASDSNGVLVCDEQFLTNIYGKDNALQLLSGQIEYDTLGVIVTDYFADSMMFYNNIKSNTADKYATLLAGEYHGFKICAVIDTGYTERYSNIIDSFVDAVDEASSLENLKMTKEYGDFLTELDSTLNVCYSFNKNFVDMYKQGLSNKNHVNFTNATIYDENNRILLQGETRHCYDDSALADNQIKITRKMYATMMGVIYDEITEQQWKTIESQAVGKKITIENYDRAGKDNPLLYEFRDMEIIEICDWSEWVFWVSPNNYQTMRQYDVFPYRLYFDNVACSAQIYNQSAELLYVPSSPLFEAVSNITKAVDAFVEFFYIIVVALCLLCALLLITFVFGCVKKNMFEIGVLRALGVKTSDIAWTFVLLMMLVGIIISTVSTIGLALGSQLCNNVLVEQFSKLTTYPLAESLSIIEFNWITVVADIAVVFVGILLCSVFPFVFIRRVKPREIIRAKE